MIRNRDYVVEVNGQARFDADMEVLTKLEAEEEKKGQFEARDDDVDAEDRVRDVDLSSGFGSLCGVKGNQLSGGQKQRVAIARTIVRQPKILLLDEATSALDEDSQKKVQLALTAAMKGRTTVTIAHRMSTIENCDKIFVLEEGKVKEEGGFNELKNKGGLFSKLQ